MSQLNLLREACATVLATYTRISADGGADAFRELARSRVVTWRSDVRNGGPDPVPWAQERFGRPPGDFGPPSRSRDEHVGLDADGVVVLHERLGAEGAPAFVLRAALAAPGGITRLRHPGTVEHLVLDDARRVVFVVSTEDGHDVEVERWTWIDGRPARGACARTCENEVGTRVTLRATFDADGRLEELRRGFASVGRFAATEQENEAPETDVEALVPALLEALATAETDPDGERIVWSSVTHRPESPRTDDDSLVEDLVAGLSRAIVATVTALGVREPFVVRVHAGRDEDNRPGPLPGQVTVGGDVIRRDARSRLASGSALQALRATRDRPADVATAPLQPACDAGTLQACRELNTLAALDTRTEENMHRADRVLGAVRVGLAQRLAATPPEDASAPFLHLVELATRYEADHDVGWQAATAAHGADHVTAFKRSLTAPAGDAPADWSQANRDRATLERFLVAGGLPEHAARLAHDVAEWGLRIEPAAGPVTSRLGGPALLPPETDWPRTTGGRALSFLAAIDLGELPAVDGGTPLPDAGVLLFFAAHDPNIEAEVLEDEAHNEPGATARVLVVPPGERAEDRDHPDELREEAGRLLRHRPITFRARLTLPTGYDAAETLGLQSASAEAYSTLAHALLDNADPGASLHAQTGGAGFEEGEDWDDDPEWDDSEWDGPDFDEDDDPSNEPDDPGLAIDVRDAVDRVMKAGRSGGWRSVLRTAHELAGEALDRMDEPSDREPSDDAGRDEAYLEDEHPDGLPPDDGRSLEGAHWVLSHETGVQGHEPEPDTVLLLHLGWDEALGFMFADGGAFQFRIPGPALAAGDWSAVVATADSS
jgi:hypothetical protein